MYEVHVTVQKADEEGFAAFCESQGARSILVEFPKPADNPLQLLCIKWVTGSLEDALKATREFSSAARERGFVPIREKIELIFSLAPDGFIPTRAKGEYWEFHYKLHMPAGSDGGIMLSKAIMDHPQWGSTARMSRSALRDQAPDSGLYRIVTLRLFTGDKFAAKGECESLKTWLTEKGYNVIKVQRELNVYDDNLNLDNGWY